MTDAAAALEAGRASYAAQAWSDAFASLSQADRITGLGAEDLERLATSAYLIGREDEFLRGLERAHDLHVDAGALPRGARCAFWIGMRLAERGEMGQATGWLGRAGRLLEHEGRDCAERGYVLLPIGRQQLMGGDPEAAYQTAAQAVETGERFADDDLTALALHLQGIARLRQARLDEGLALLDEAMVAVASGKLSPQVTGLIYCSVIGACRSVYALGRAHEWTAALADWCARQPDMVAYSGECLVYRAEIMQLRGAWRSAIEEAVRARERFGRGTERSGAAAAFYQQAEVHRLLGEYEKAEAAYRSANTTGREPQPGLALLRLAQGRTDAAAAAIRRVLAETPAPLKRAALLPACVEIELAANETDAARNAAGELEEIARRFGTDVLRTMVAQASGAIELAEGDAKSALVELRRAVAGWQSIEAPYEAARVRVLLAVACRSLGDNDTASLEFDAARAAFEQLGAAPDVDRVDSLAGAATARDADHPDSLSGAARDTDPADSLTSAARDASRTNSPTEGAQAAGAGDRRARAAAQHGAPARRTHGLTPRECEVLRLLATGKTNRVIGTDLFISEKTVARHVSNIFAKLGVSSRAAATAFAYEHDIL